MLDPEQLELLGKTVNEEDYLKIQELKRVLCELFKEHYDLNDAALACLPIDNLAYKLLEKLKTRFRLQIITP